LKTENDIHFKTIFLVKTTLILKWMEQFTIIQHLSLVVVCIQHSNHVAAKA